MNNCKKSNDWYYTEFNSTCKIPKTTTQEMLETGILVAAGQKATLRRQLNFQSYPVNIANLIKKEREQRKKEVAITTSYKQVFTEHNPRICGPLEIEYTPDPLLNRKPVPDFPSTDLTNFKFMDDHFINVSEHRKKINFLRQLRNSHHPFV